MYLIVQRLVQICLLCDVFLVGSEPMTLGSPTSPKLAPGAQFLPGFLMGDLPAPATPQPRPFNLASPLADSTGTFHKDIYCIYCHNRSQLMIMSVYLWVFSCTSGVGVDGPGSAPQPVVPTPKDKSGAPPVRSIHDDLITATTPLSAHRQVSKPTHSFIRPTAM